MFASMSLRVHLLLLLILIILIQYCKTQGAPEEEIGREEDNLVVPNQRQNINDCHFRYYKYATPRPAYPAAAQGRRAYLREFAHMAAIGWSQSTGPPIWNCGGSLIWDNFVLTAAHCAADTDNVAPDVTRFGDLNLYEDDDDQYAQQRKIIEIIRHPDHAFSRRYHDIALMRLETRVSFHDTVAPACLWSDDETRFKTMEATGWGDTGFGEKRSPFLLKVSLSPVDPERCSQHYLNTRGLRAGLHANQICAGDVKMDTCPGDSGGPLQVKLLHNTHVTPFVVGVTSFGTACGQSVPGVYTRVAPYVSWIQSVLNKHGENATESMFSPQACALRYINYRELDPAVVKSASKDYEALDFSDAHLFQTRSPHRVTIHWDRTNSTNKMECFGVIIDESTIVTLARCTEIKGIPPSYIRYEGDQTKAVANYFRHPQYEENSLYNDIGLLKLKSPFTFSDSFFPACLWHEKDMPVEKIALSGRGIRELNLFDPQMDDILSDETVDVYAVGYTHVGPNCSLPKEYTPRLVKGLTEEHLCVGADLFLVPDTCDQSLGGPIQSIVYFGNREFTNVYALNLFGRDCGYGESAVGIKFSPHTQWMESILMPKRVEEDPMAPVVFLHSELEEGDRCEPPARGSDGICVPSQYCPKVTYDFQSAGQVLFCQTGSLMCCPREFIRNGTDAEWREIDECEKLHTLRQKSSEISQNVVSVIWKAETEAKSCLGTIISSRTIITAANCVGGTTFPANVSIEQADGSVLKSIAVERVITHPEFDSSTKQHNIALIKTQERLDESLRKGSACLWTNTTHTPFYLTQISHNKSLTDDTEAVPSYSVDCEGTFGRALLPQELCVYVSGWQINLFGYLDAPALWEKRVADGNSIPYLVGIGSEKASDDSRVFLHTRVSSYVTWIKSVL